MDQEIKEVNLPEQSPAPQPPEDAQPLSVEESCLLLSTYLEDILRDASQARLDMRCEVG